MREEEEEAPLHAPAPATPAAALARGSESPIDDAWWLIWEFREFPLWSLSSGLGRSVCPLSMQNWSFGFVGLLHVLWARGACSFMRGHAGCLDMSTQPFAKEGFEMNAGRLFACQQACPQRQSGSL